VAKRLPPRVRLALSICVGAIVGVLAVVIVTGGGANGGGAAQGLSLTDGFAGARLPPNIPPPDFTLHDQNGHTVRLSAYAGKVVILTFLYSTCQDTCPLIAQQIRGALDQVAGGGAQVPALAVSVDPTDDTPLNAQRFLFKQSVVGRMSFLLGTRAQLQPIWRSFGIAPQSAGTSTRSDHSVDTILLDKVGRPTVGFQADLLTPEALAHDVRKLEAQPPTAHPPARVQL
jgi:protein SCO1/2